MQISSLAGEAMQAHNNQKVFSSNENNKLQFINLLSKYLQADGHSVQNSSGDADTMIVAHALQYVVQGHEVNVVADNTDDLVLLNDVSLEA